MNGDRWIKEAYEAILAGDFERAIACFEHSIAEEPLNASYHYKLAVTCARSEKLEQALDAAVTAYGLEPENAIYLQLVGQIRARLLLRQASAFIGVSDAKTDDAIRLLKRAVELDPLSAEALLILAAALGERHRLDEAVQTAKEALRLDPGRKEGKRLLADLQRKMKAQQKSSDKRGRNGHDRILH